MEAIETLKQASEVTGADAGMNEMDEVVALERVSVQAYEIERKFVTRLHEVLGAKYEVLINQIIGGAYIDIVLRGKSLLTKDYLLELKCIEKGFNYSWLRQAALKLRYARTLYANATNRLPNTLLVIVSNEEVWKSPKYQHYLERLRDEFPQSAAKNRIVYMTVRAIESSSPAEFEKTLGIYA